MKHCKQINPDNCKPPCAHIKRSIIIWFPPPVICLCLGICLCSVLTYKEPWLRPLVPSLCLQVPGPLDNRPPKRHNSDSPSLFSWSYFDVVATSCLACIRVVVELSPLRGFDIQAKWRNRPEQCQCQCQSKWVKIAIVPKSNL